MKNTHKEKNQNKLKWLLIAQSITLFGSGIVFPFYIIYIREIGASFTEFSIAYALFTLSSAFVHQKVGTLSDKYGKKNFLILSSLGTSFLFLLFPLATSIITVYLLQVLLGIFGAMHKTCEKILVADLTSKEERGKQVGIYHGKIAIFSALAIVCGGYLIDLFTLPIIFYIGSIILFLSTFPLFKINEQDK